MSFTESTSPLGSTGSRTDDLKASPPMFSSPWLDRLSRVHPAVPVVLFGPAILILLGEGLARMSILGTLAAIAGGYLVWTLTEYWLHRVVFHFEPDHRLGARLHWIMHGVHHDHPNDPKRLVMPPSVSVPLALLFAVGFIATLGRPTWLPFTAGFLGGYLFYDMTHYYVHHHRPRSAAGRKLRELHMRHHFQDATTGFGVSVPWLDHVFGTAPRAKRGPGEK
jgi:dihydroceramide fatty acyl 2-hydroxylase